MADPTALFALTGLAAAGTALASLAALRAFRGWLELKRIELSARSSSPARSDVAMLRERVRRLEAIADGR
jgi:hypothetical protein